MASGLANTAGCAPVPAATAAPDALLCAATTMVAARLGSRDAAGFEDLVEANIAPLFDFPRMTRLSMARNWVLASPAQQGALVEEFRTLLVHTYAAALEAYGGDAIDYRPLRIPPGETSASVKSTLQRPGTERMSIDYAVEKTAAGWKVYDVAIAGISLVSIYQSTFASAILEGGVEGLLATLAAKNRPLGFAPVAKDRGALLLLLLQGGAPGLLQRR